MNNENVSRVIELQKMVNYQIDTKGQADIELVNDLMNMCDSLTSEEIDELDRRINEIEVDDFDINYQIDMLIEEDWNKRDAVCY